MEQYGTVIKEDGDLATVRLQRHLTCENCGRCGIMSGSSRRDMVVSAINKIEAKRGQRVLMETDHRQVLFISFMLYIVPLIVLIAGIASGAKIAVLIGFQGNEDLLSVGVGFSAMLVVYLSIRTWDKRVRDDNRYKPVITGLVDREIPEIEGERDDKEI